MRSTCLELNMLFRVYKMELSVLELARGEAGYFVHFL